MDKERLEAYRSNKAEIKELKYKLAHLAGDDSLIGNSVILDYRKGYPQPQSVVGRDLDLEQRRRERWEALIGKLQAEVDEVERWIDGIPDGLTRRCFRMVYVDGMTQQKAAMKLHLSQSAVSYRMIKEMEK
jgi:DNA-directed RNA polymerase specialized sigma24 family protein